MDFNCTRQTRNIATIYDTRPTLNRSVMIHSSNSNRLLVDSHLSIIYYRTKPKSSISLIVSRYLFWPCRAVYLYHQGNIDIIEIIHQYYFNFFNSRPISRNFFFVIFVEYHQYLWTQIKAFSQIKHFISRDFTRPWSYFRLSLAVEHSCQEYLF